MYALYVCLLCVLRQVREWQTKLRKEGRQLDRQILGIYLLAVFDVLVLMKLNSLNLVILLHTISKSAYVIQIYIEICIRRWLYTWNGVEPVQPQDVLAAG